VSCVDIVAFVALDCICKRVIQPFKTHKSSVIITSDFNTRLGNK
jgi:hypothetical protein